MPIYEVLSDEISFKYTGYLCENVSWEAYRQFEINCSDRKKFVSINLREIRVKNKAQTMSQ